MFLVLLLEFFASSENAHSCMVLNVWFMQSGLSLLLLLMQLGVLSRDGFAVVP